MKKNSVYFIVGILIAIIVVIGCIILFNKNDKSIASNVEIEVPPADTTRLYDYFVDVSCEGALYFDDITQYDKVYTVDKINKSLLLKYVFSYLDKSNVLDDIKIKKINKISKYLFAKSIKFDIDEIQYGDYLYNLKDGSKEESSCTVDRKYISSLIGYTYDNEYLYIDINMGYLGDNDLYDLSGEKISEYSIDRDPVDLFINNSYYRITYVIDGDLYKFYSVELRNKS